MTWTRRTALSALPLLVSAVTACRDAAPNLAAQQAETRPQSRIVLDQPLPKLDGARLEVKVIEVTYAPGAASTPHRHPCPVVGYVLEGELRSHVKGRADTVYREGETFFEGPDDVHLGARSASTERPARLLATFTCDRETPLSVPVPDP